MGREIKQIAQVRQEVNHFTELSLRLVFAKANNTMLLYNDSVPAPKSLSLLSVLSKGYFIHFSSLPKTFGICTKEEI